MLQLQGHDRMTRKDFSIRCPEHETIEGKKKCLQIFFNPFAVNVLNSYLLGLRHWEIMAFLKTEDGNNIGIIAMRLLPNECNMQTYLTKKLKEGRNTGVKRLQEKHKVLCGRPSGSSSYAFSYCQQKECFFPFFWRVCFLDLSPWQQQGQIRCTKDLTETQEILPDLLLHLLHCWFLFPPNSKRAEESASRECAAHEYMNNRSLQKQTINLYYFVGAPSGPPL